MRLKLTCKHCRRNVEIEGEGHVPSIECPNCKVVIHLPSNILDMDSELGGFKIIRHLGSGSMGCVYLAKQISMDRDVAIKVLPPEVKAREEELQNFMKEVRLLAKLDHPHIVTAFEAGNVDDNYYMAMTYVDGETLEDKIKRDGPLDEVEALTVTRKISEALKYAWEKHHILHRDVKPENIMVDERNSEPKLLDMGISRALNEEANDSADKGVLVGTPHYMSPEQAKSQNIDFRADMYSLGCSLYQFLTGQVPYDEESVMNVLAKHALDPIPNPLDLNPDIHPATVDLLKKMMAKSPDHRFGSWTALIKEIRHTMHLVKTGAKPKIRHGAGARKGIAVRGTPTRADEVMARMHEDEFKEPSPQKKLVKLLTTILVVMMVVLGAVLLVMRLSGPSANGDDNGDNAGKSGGGDTEMRNKIEEARRKLEEKKLAKKRAEEDEKKRRLDGLARRFRKMVATEPKQPHSFEPTLARYRTLLTQAEGTPTEPLVKRRIESLLVIQATESARVLKDLKAKAAPLILAADYEGAVKLYRNYSGSCTYETSEKRIEIMNRLLVQQARQLEAKLEFGTFTEKAANLLAHGHYDKARAFAKPFVDRRGNFGSEANLICEVGTMDALVVDSFTAQVGKKIPVSFINKNETLKITKVVGGVVYSYKDIVFGGSTGKEAVNFKPTELHPTERLKILKRTASPDVFGLMKGLVAMEIKKYSIARAEFSRSSTSLAKTLIQYVDIKSGNPEEWAEVEFKILLKSVGIKEGELIDMNAQVMKLTPSPTEKVLLRQALDVFIFRFGTTKKARSFGSFLFLLRDMLGQAEPIDKAQIEKVLQALRNANRIKGLKSKVEPVVGGIRMDLSGNLGLKYLAPLTDLKIRELILRDTSVTDLESLGAMPLRSLDVSNTPVRSLKTLKCKMLQTLSIASTRVRVLPNFQSFSVLTTLDASKCPLTSIRGLSGSTVNTLNIEGCASITDLKPLFTLPNLRTLVIAREVKDFFGLRRLAQVERIGFSANNLKESAVFWNEVVAQASQAMRNAQEPKVRLALASLLRRHANPDLEFGELIRRISYHPTGIGLNFGWQRDIHDLSDFKDIPVAVLEIEGTGVTSLEPFQNSPVEILNAKNTKLQSLAPVANAPLTLLDLRWSASDPLPLLKQWPNLRELHCGSERLSSLKLFEDTKLESLTLLGGTFKDLSPLVDNPLKSLRIESAPISDLTPLSKCETLSNLFLPNTKISDLSPLSGLTLLRLDVSHTKVSTLSPIDGDPLVGLWISNTVISDLAPLSKTKLTTFHADNTPLSDISILRGMPIRNLHLGGTKVLDFGLIGTFAELSELWVHDTVFNDVGLLRGKQLRELRLDGCDTIPTLEPLAGQNRLRNLTIPRRDIEGVWVLARLERLRRISVRFDNWRTRVDQFFEQP